MASNKDKEIWSVRGNFVSIHVYEDRCEIRTTSLTDLRRNFLKDKESPWIDDPNHLFFVNEIIEHDLCNVIEDILFGYDEIAYVSDAQDGCVGYNDEIIPVFGIVPLSNTPLIGYKPVYDEYHDKFTDAEMVFYFPQYQVTSEMLTLINDENLIFRRVDE